MKNIPVDVKYRAGNGVAKELTCMIHVHEQCCGNFLREWVEGGKEEIGTTVIA